MQITFLQTRLKINISINTLTYTNTEMAVTIGVTATFLNTLHS